MKKKLLFIFVIALILLTADVSASILWFNYVNEEEQEIYGKRVQVAIILMGDFDDNFKSLGKETLRRIDHGISLYRQGLVDNLFCVGGARPEKNTFGSEYMKQVLIENGVPPERILTERQSYDSVSNWTTAKQIIKAKNWNIVSIISSPLHIHRLKRTVLEKPLVNLYVLLSPYSYDSYEETRLELTSFALWKQVHYEWLSYLSHHLLPETIYRHMLKIYRHQ